MARISDVAKQASVAPSIVSRLLNADPNLRIREGTRDRILAAIEDLGYIPNSAARSLRTAASGALGILVPNVTSPIYAEILRGAEHEGDQAGYALFLANVDDLVNDRSRYDRLVSGKRIDGLLLQRPDTNYNDILTSFMSSVPTVLVNSRVRGHRGSVILEDAKGATLAMEHLLELGHTRIAHLGGPAALDTSRRRRSAYVQSLARHGLTHEVSRVMKGSAVRAYGTSLDEVLRQKPTATAIFAASVTTAVTTLTGLRQRGIRVPEDISVVAMHDMWFAENTWPPLTTVRMPLYEMGKTAARTLIDAIRSNDAPPDIIIHDPPPTLVLRESTAPPRT